MSTSAVNPICEKCGRPIIAPAPGLVSRAGSVWHPECIAFDALAAARSRIAEMEAAIGSEMAAPLSEKEQKPMTSIPETSETERNTLKKLAEEANSDEQVCALIKEKATYNRALVKANARIAELEKALQEITLKQKDTGNELDV